MLQELQVQLVLQDPLEPPELQDLKEQLVQPQLQVLWAPLVTLVPLVRLAQQVLQALQVQPALPV